jgi:hypothetical protein
LFHFPRIFPIFIQYFHAIPVFAKIGKYFSPFSTYFQNFQGDRSVFFSPPRQSVSGTHLSRAVSAWAEPGSSAEEKTQVQLSKSAPEVDEISPVDGCFIP